MNRYRLQETTVYGGEDDGRATWGVVRNCDDATIVEGLSREAAERLIDNLNAPIIAPFTSAG